MILTDQALSGYDCILCVDGAELNADEVNAAERACLIFDGHDDQALTQAGSVEIPDGRGCSAQYWSEEREVGVEGAKIANTGPLG